MRRGLPSTSRGRWILSPLGHNKPTALKHTRREPTLMRLQMPKEVITLCFRERHGTTLTIHEIIYVVVRFHSMGQRGVLPK